MAYNNRGLALLYLGQYEGAEQDLQSAYQQGVHSTQPYSLLNLGVLAWHQGAQQRAWRYLKTALPLWQKRGRQLGHLLTLLMLAKVHMAVDQYGELGLGYLQQAEAIVHKLDNEEATIDYYNSWGRFYYGQQQYEAALRAYLQGETVARESNGRYYDTIRLFLGLARLNIAMHGTSSLNEAKGYAVNALQGCREMGLAGNEPIAHLYLGKIHLLQENKESALSACRQALKLIQTQPAVHVDLADIYRFAADILTAYDEPSFAEQYRIRAQQLMEAVKEIKLTKGSGEMTN